MLNKKAVAAYLSKKREVPASSTSSSSSAPASSSSSVTFAKRRRTDAPAPPRPIPRLAALLAKSVRDDPSMAPMLPAAALPSGDLDAALAASDSTDDTDDENEADGREEGREGEDDDAAKNEEKGMADVLSWIRGEAKNLTSEQLAKARPLFAVAKRGYDLSTNDTYPRLWRLRSDGTLGPAHREPNDKTDLVLGAHKATGETYLFLVFALMLGIEEGLTEEYRQALNDGTPISISRLLNPQRDARKCKSAGLYLLRSPSGNFYLGMANQVWIRMAGHAKAKPGGSALDMEKELHAFNEWSATVILEADEVPTAVIHIMESLLIASTLAVRRDAGGLNTRVFDHAFPQRSIVPGKYVVSLFTAVHAHLSAGNLLPHYPDRQVYRDQWTTLFGSATGHRFRPSYMYKLVQGRERRYLTEALCYLYPISPNSWEGMAPAVVSNQPTGRDLTAFSRASSRRTTEERESAKAALKLKTRPLH